MKRNIALLFSLAMTLGSSVSCAGSPSGDRPAYYKAEFRKLTLTQSIWPPNGQLADLLPELKKKALAGDAQAAAAIYAGLSACDASSRYGDDQKLRAHCRDVSPDDIRETGRCLTLAAKLGDARAQYTYGAGSVETVFGNALEAMRNPDELKKYRALARSYIDRLATQCNADAIGAIVTDASDNGLVYGNDPELAYKFLNVLNIVRTSPDLAAERTLETRVAQKRLFSLKNNAIAFVEANCE